MSHVLVTKKSDGTIIGIYENGNRCIRVGQTDYIAKISLEAMGLMLQEIKTETLKAFTHISEDKEVYISFFRSEQEARESCQKKNRIFVGEAKNIQPIQIPVELLNDT